MRVLTHCHLGREGGMDLTMLGSCESQTPVPCPLGASAQLGLGRHGCLGSAVGGQGLALAVMVGVAT